jgi:integrase
MSPLLVFYPDQVKTRRAVEVRLSPRTWRLISIYCKHYRPILRGADRSTLLFPGQTTKSPEPTHFAESVCNVVPKRLGVRMNMHLWRHLLGTKVAEMREQVEDAGRLLGHVPGSSSTASYVRVGTRIAAKWLSQITDEACPRGMELLTGRSSDRQ